MDIRIGKVTHYYNKISVAVLELSETLNVGDQIAFIGHTTEFSQPVEPLEIQHLNIQSAGPGQEVALKVWETVRKGDLVYRVVE